PSAVYGPRDRGFLPLFRLAKRGWFVRPAPGSTCFTLIDVHDLATASILAATEERAAGETLFIGHGEPQSTDAVFGTLASIYGRRYSAVPLPRPVVRLAAAIGDLSWQFGLSFVFDSGRLAELDAEGFVCSTERAREVLKFTARTPLHEGL